jgi:hypothetical protein
MPAGHWQRAVSSCRQPPRREPTSSHGKFTIVVSVEGENAKRLQLIAAERGPGIDEVVADLVRWA